MDGEATAAAGIPLIRVADSLIALELAAAWRDRLSLRVVGITGSSGKTSTKEFTAAVLAAVFRVTRPVATLNNHIGLPLTVLTATSRSGRRMGNGHEPPRRDFAPRRALARPDMAIITNIGIGHIEFFGYRDAIAAEKAEPPARRQMTAPFLFGPG